MVICPKRGADLHMAQRMPLPLTVSCFSKIQIGLPVWYRLTWVMLERGPLNGCVFLLALRTSKCGAVRCWRVSQKDAPCSISTCVNYWPVYSRAMHAILQCWYQDLVNKLHTRPTLWLNEVECTRIARP